ncbi:MAG: CoB--CoM heterodisulfide reductase iron-sulfur subunit B family protein [Negativicutes bacterium]|nr:CoB--CoM heterodisulfide reductase iron-sulfur subunit B family protein [Negativicutes bacterium]
MSTLKKVSLINRDRVSQLPIPQKLFLFLSCTGSIEYPGTEKSIKIIADKLGIELVESADQTCCSGYMLTCNAMKPILALAATARNLSIPESMGLDVAAFCNGCYAYMNELAHLVGHHAGFKPEVDAIMAKIGREFTGKVRIFHVQELWYRQLEKIASLQKQPLNGLKIAAHYGCHYLANKAAAIDDSADPTFIEEIVERLGGTPVFYPERRACCGYSVGRGFTHRDDIVIHHLARKMASAVDNGVDLMVTTCPGCNVALDREQPALREMGISTNIAVIDISQLIAFALGAPLDQLGFAANTTPVLPVLEKMTQGQS